MEIRKIFTVIDELYSEQGQKVDKPVKKVATVAIVKNPYAGKYVEDLSYLVDSSVEIGRKISKIAVEAMGDEEIQSYAKGGVVGLAGEHEHAVAMLTGVFGDELRKAVGGGKAWIPSVKKRGGVGTTIDIPLAHKDALYVRSHLDNITLTLHDAPHEDEIAVIVAVANRGRPNSRLGGLLLEDMEGKDGLR